MNLNTPPKGAVTLREALEKFQHLPPSIDLLPGVPPNSCGQVFGPSKAGKTIYTECALLSIAAGRSEFMNVPIHATGKQCLYISFEEDSYGRQERNTSQLKEFTPEEREQIFSNFVVSDRDLPSYLYNEQDWRGMEDIIAYHKPNILCIDSVSRLTTKKITEEDTAKELFERIKGLTRKYQLTCILINHIPKNGNEYGLNINSVSGSRIFVQESDFLLGINKTNLGDRYVKIVASRYRKVGLNL